MVLERKSLTRGRELIIKSALQRNFKNTALSFSTRGQREVKKNRF
jgi:hypothetical protein